MNTITNNTNSICKTTASIIDSPKQSCITLTGTSDNKKVIRAPGTVWPLEAGSKLRIVYKSYLHRTVVIPLETLHCR